MTATAEKWTGGEGAREANDRFAPVYDEFTGIYENVRWTGTLLGRAEAAGLRGDRLLDVACGTGLSAIPMLERGWTVTACDVSGEMVSIARAKIGDRATVQQADMRELPMLGGFDLVWAVGDAVNYLLSAEELTAALTGMRRNLAPGGVVVFDVNALATFRTVFVEGTVREAGERRFLWKGRLAAEAVRPGVIAEALFEAKGEPGSRHVHRQRHFPEAEVLAAIEAAELACVEVSGELKGELSSPLDEERHGKAVYVCSLGPRSR